MIIENYPQDSWTYSPSNFSDYPKKCEGEYFQLYWGVFSTIMGSIFNYPGEYFQLPWGVFSTILSSPTILENCKTYSGNHSAFSRGCHFSKIWPAGGSTPASTLLEKCKTSSENNLKCGRRCREFSSLVGRSQPRLWENMESCWFTLDYFLDKFGIILN